MADKSEEKEKPPQFTVEVGKLALTREQIDQIQNDIARVVAERVNTFGDEAVAKFGQWGSFGSWGSFNKGGPFGRLT